MLRFFFVTFTKHTSLSHVKLIGNRRASSKHCLDFGSACIVSSEKKKTNYFHPWGLCAGIVHYNADDLVGNRVNDDKRKHKNVNAD